MSGGITRAAEQAVFVRRTNPIDGEISGWRHDPYLRCQDVAHRAGPNPGDARFVYVPPTGASVAIEDVLDTYHPDNQVRVEVFPYDSALGADSGTDSIGLVVFEGVLERQPLQVASAGEREREKADFVAVAMPWVDNRSIEHLVTGRWMYNGGEVAWDRIESPEMPAVFNYRGRGNMDASDLNKLTAGGLPDGVTLTGRPFTHDDDANGQHWTVREALKSTLVQWLYGHTGATRNRMTGVEPATFEALEGGAAAGRFAGLDDVLPETDVSGLRVFEAVQAICRSAGFEFAITISTQTSDADLGGNASNSADRRYLLRIWRRHAGPAVDLKLPKRDQFPSSAAETHRRANMPRITALRDNTGIVNHVFARGRVLIEAGVELKPLWSLDDMILDTPDAAFQQPAQEVNDPYHNRHVQGGSLFADYGHIGRVWGRDCTGAATVAGLFYATGDYAHAPAGFDWLDYLGIDGEDDLTAERTARNIDAETDPIFWSKRVRRPLPLRRADSEDRGRRFVLEVSEDNKSSWIDVTDRVSFTTLRDFFGIRLSGIGNLAAVNAESLATGKTPGVADSWWQKIYDRELWFRLTCLIEADHAALYRADQQDSSGTVYSRGELLDVDIDEVWSHSSSALNESAGWEKITATPGTPADASDAIAAYADRYRDAHEGTRWSVGCDAFLLQPDRWVVGDRVTGITGRGVSFATNAGPADRHPTIYGVRLTLAGPGGEGSAQAVFLELNDAKQRRGV